MHVLVFGKTRANVCAHAFGTRSSRVDVARD